MSSTGETPLPPHGEQPAPWPPGQPSGHPGAGYSYPPLPTVPPKHPRATMSLVLGLIAACGTFCCLVPVLLSPIAWYHGARTRREIDRAPGRWSGRGEATAGMVMGIIGVALIVIILLGLATALAIALALQSVSY